MKQKRLKKNRTKSFKVLVNKKKFNRANAVRQDTWPNLVERMFDEQVKKSKGRV